MNFPIKLVYSYCHKDTNFREAMEKSLAHLKNAGLLSEWSDVKILPGQNISNEVRKKMDKAEIVVFLFSQDFINSPECMREWRNAKELATKKSSLVRVPIILTDCAWLDVLSDDDIKALPTDGIPITKYDDHNEAWQIVYEGIKAIIKQQRENYTLKEEFKEKMEITEFLANQKIKLQDIFVFLDLSCYPPQAQGDQLLKETITDEPNLLKKDYTIVLGEEMSGKSALAKHLFLYLCERKSAVLYVDLQEVTGVPKESVFSKAYQDQFNGDYSLWKKQDNRTLILDNLSAKRDAIDFVTFAQKSFDKLIITVSSDIFDSYYRDDHRLAEFYEVKIQKLKHHQQEELIRKRLSVTNDGEKFSDGRVDEIENRVNSIIISNRIVPRYPFYVLAILQTYEAFMPDNMSITSYGHCYQALIVANLIKSGVSNADVEINVCFNFAEELAFRIYQNSEIHIVEKYNFNNFVEEYRQDYVIHNRIINRIKSPEYGILSQKGEFRVKYIYYFFLGRYLSKNRIKHGKLIESMCENSHEASNYLTLLFLIHHTNDDMIIDSILLRTMCTLDFIQQAELNRRETKKFESVVANMNENILSRNSVETNRKHDREARETCDQLDEVEQSKSVNYLYRILKNNEILGQILRNNFGKLKRSRIEEIVETIADGGLRLVNSLLEDEGEINQLAEFIMSKKPNYSLEEVKGALRYLSFIWTMLNIEKIVSAINFPEIRQEVNRVVSKKSTPAYDLIGYFSHLDSAYNLSDTTKNELKGLLNKYDDEFVRRVLSLRTQHYMNTHRSKTPIEQSVCSLLKLNYTPNRYRP